MVYKTEDAVYDLFMTETQAPHPKTGNDWFVGQTSSGQYFTVDLDSEGKTRRVAPSSARDIAQAQLRGNFRDLACGYRRPIQREKTT